MDTSGPGGSNQSQSIKSIDFNGSPWIPGVLEAGGLAQGLANPL